jgi:hypothetical protein
MDLFQIKRRKNNMINLKTSRGVQKNKYMKKIKVVNKNTVMKEMMKPMMPKKRMMNRMKNK